jgi:two-component system sensor histidine kinase HydH
MVARDHLTQVMLNLVLNAIDATDEQGHIDLHASADDGCLKLSVGDDGRGILLADRCRLFQPFFTTKAHGTGLGLFVCRQILEEFSGTLTYFSEPGKGSTFVVRLPVRSPDAVEAGDSPCLERENCGSFGDRYGDQPKGAGRPSPVPAMPGT